MNHPRTAAALLLALTLPFAVRAQPAPPPRLPEQAVSPLLHVRILGPGGMHVTVYQGARVGREFDAPVQLGMRPGYIYRLELSRIPGHPGVTLYPTLEVRGTLQLPPGLRSGDYPAPVVFNQDELDRVIFGSVVTKVVFLEDPETALPAAASRDRPFEIEVRPLSDPLAEARLRGRPLVIVRLGERGFSPEEMARDSVPGTVLLPGERSLGPAMVRPPWAWDARPFVDPVLGPRPPTEECLHDGGDVDRPAGLDAEGGLLGVDPSDTVAAYTDAHGQRHLSVSNRVCVCVPRFAVTRTEAALNGYAAVVAPAGTRGLEGQASLTRHVPAGQALQNVHLDALAGREKASAAVGVQALDRMIHVQVLNAEQIEAGVGFVLGTEGLAKLAQAERLRLDRMVELARRVSQVEGPRGIGEVQLGAAVVGQVEGLEVSANVQTTREVTVSCHEGPCPPDKPLVLHKWADREAAQVGDVVTFFLKYSNVGGRPITRVAVSDSLTGRLEYVPGSARTNRDAILTTQVNAAGSLLLHWEISDPLPPGQSGIVTFQARVR